MSVQNINDVTQVKKLLSSFAEARPHERCCRVMSPVDSENLAHSWKRGRQGQDLRNPEFCVKEAVFPLDRRSSQFPDTNAENGEIGEFR